MLKINKISRVDRGTYYCTADNGVGVDTKTINFEVEFPPAITVVRPKVAQALDYDIELECKIEAYPAPAVTWHKNGTQIFNSHDYRLN